MKSNKRAIAVLAVAQIACLACGLWIRDRFLLATVDWQAENAVAAETVSAADATTTSVSGSMSQATDHGLNLVRRAMPVVMVLALVWIGGMQSVVAYLVLTRLMAENSQNHAQSQMRLMCREKDLVRTRNAVIFGLAKLAEYRDRETGQHLERIALYSTCLASELRRDSRFRERVSPTLVKTIGISSVLHDIGKVGISDSILRKNGPLDDDQRRRMQQHTLIGAECIRQIEQRLGNCNFLQMARAIAQNHHERWDGKGYPAGLASGEIPMVARVVAIADVYDALASKRVYKDAFPHEKCVELIVESAGTHLDPDMVDVFLRVEDKFREIASRFSDPQDHEEDLSGELEFTNQPAAHPRDNKLIRSILEQGENPSETLVAAP